MQVSIEATGTLERCLTVKIPEEQITSEVANRITSLSRTARIQGFRPGKAPLKLVQRLYGDQVRQEVIGEVIRSSFVEAINTNGLRPAGDPSIESIDAGSDQGFAYKATFEVYPEITLAPLESLKIMKPVCEITEEDIDKRIEDSRRQRQRWESVDRPAQKGDQLDVDFQGTVEGETVGETKGFKFELGSGRLIAGFEEGLIGASASNERRLDLVFPSDYQDPKLAGKPVEFTIKVNSVSEPVLPDLNEDLFREYGVSEGGLARFREELRKRLQYEGDQSARDKMKAQVMEALLNANPIEIPRVLMEAEARRLQQQARMRALIYQMAPEEVEALSPAMFEKQAQRRVALGLILSAIIRSADLKAGPAKVRSMVERLAASHEDPASVIKWYYEDRERLHEVEMAVLEEEVVEWVLTRAHIEERPMTFGALMSPEQNEGSEESA
jgi:trigger factor